MSKKNMMADIEKKFDNANSEKIENKKKSKESKKQLPKKKKKIDTSNEEMKEFVILKELNSQIRHPHPIRISQEILKKARRGSEKKNIKFWEYISLAIYKQLEIDNLL